MNDKNAAIGVFDSGVGGLTVAREIIRQLPEESITYFGDTARVPYGSKSKDTIIRYSRQIIRFLKTKNVKAIVVACNTASAFALDTIEKEIDIHKAAEALDQVMDTLAPREKEILRLRYGLTDGKEYTLEEVSQKFGVTRERIRQIEAKALRKLRHPVRGRILHKYIE